MGVPDRRSGLDEQGRWMPAFEGQRPPFEPGNDLGVRHGAYSLRVAPAAEEKADLIRQVCPAYSPADEFAVRSLAVTLVRIERAQAALDQVDQDADEKGKGALSAYLGAGVKLDGLRADLRAWINSAGKLLDALGMTPTSRAKLGLDLAQARRAWSVVELHAAADAEVVAEAEEAAG